MSTKWQKIAVNIPKAYTPAERQAIGKEIVDLIRTRTQVKQVDKNGKPFAKYSKEYVKSLNFKIGGKSKGEVNLTLSGDMLGALDVISDASGKVVVGYQNGTQENGIADGNIRGTYGKSSPTGPRRDFLGISKSELQKILQNYPLDDRKKSLQNAEEVLATDSGAANFGADEVGGE